MLHWLLASIHLLAGTEKPTRYYMHNHFFYLKMAALLVLLLLEVRAVTFLIGCRRAAGQGRPVDTGAAPGLARISYVQVALVAVILAGGTAMARGTGGGS